MNLVTKLIIKTENKTKEEDLIKIDHFNNII